MKHFSIEMLPAGYGDCLWIEYGDDHETHRILIDGGLSPTHALLVEKLETLPEDRRSFDLVVCTHIDLDHISGLLKFFAKPPPGVSIGDVWFNGWKQIEPFHALLGAMQGEKLSEFIKEHGLQHNAAFNGKAVVIPDTGALRTIDLPGGMKITLLGPTAGRLTALAEEWHETITGKGLIPGEAAAGEIPEPTEEIGVLGALDVQTLATLPFKEDRSAPNGSSIAFLAEYGGKSALFTGDAFPTDILKALERWNSSTGNPRVTIDAFKISHHGGKPNTSPALLSFVNCPHYLLSSNGVSHGHPDCETIVRVLVHAPDDATRHLHFNYHTEFNSVWDDSTLRAYHKYATHYPDDGQEGIALTLI
jgi:beta-lactamase superfamily II metal-dependent hydrolase